MSPNTKKTKIKQTCKLHKELKKHCQKQAPPRPFTKQINDEESCSLKRQSSVLIAIHSQLDIHQYCQWR